MSSAWLKYGIVFLGVLFVRLLPFRAPNVEPLLAAVMPLTKRFGAIEGAGFAALSIVLYDALTAGIGIWTLVTACAYGAVAVGAHVYFKQRSPSRGNFIRFSIVAVLLYDVVTGFTVGPLAFGQSLSAAIAGQVPFTILHLLGAVLFAAVVSPLLYRWLQESEMPASSVVPAANR
jgi:uncharacterized membrane protein